MVRAAFRRLQAPFREFGPVSGLLYVLARLLPAISRHLRLFVYDLMVQPTAKTPLLAERPGGSFHTALVKPDSPVLEKMPVPPTVILARFAQGAVCLGVWRGESFAGYLWLAPDRYDEDEVRCHYNLSPAGKSAFDFDVYILPEYRLGFAFVVLWDGANAWLRQNGIDYSFSRISRFNISSRRAHSRLGSRRLGTALFFGIGPLQLMVATVPPFCGVSWSTSGGVTLRLRAPRVLRDAR
jgi:hypothetical protein